MMKDFFRARKQTPVPGSGKAGRFSLFYGNVIVAAAFLALMTMFGSQYSFGIFFKPMLDQFGWSRALTSGAYSINTVLQGFLGILAGRLSDRYGPRIVVSISALFLGLGYMLMSQISSVWQIYFFYGVLISMGSCIWVPLQSTVARWFTKRRGLMSGIVSSGIGFGIISGPLLANHLISNYNWRISYLILGILALLIVMITAQFLKRDPGKIGLTAYGESTSRSQTHSAGFQGYSLQEAVRTRQFWIICLAFFTTNFCTQVIIVHIVPHATDIGISATAAVTVLSTIGILSIISKIGVGGAIDRLGSRPIISTVTILMVVAFLWMIFSGELWMLYLFAVIFAFGYGGASALQAPMIAEYFGLKAHGAIMGMVLIGNFTGGAAGPLIAGRIFDISNGYSGVFIVCIVLSLTALAATWRLKSDYRKLESPA